MNDRERFVATLCFEKADRAPFIPLFGPWGTALERWRKEGLGRDQDWRQPFGFDKQWAHPPVNLGYCPAFKEEVLEDLGDAVIHRDAKGIVKKDKKDRSSMPKFLSYPVKDRDDWELLKAERLDPDDPARFPPNWAQLVKDYARRDYPLVIGWFPYGLFGTPRDMMGAEELLMAFHTDPTLVKDIMTYLTDFWIKLWGKVLDSVDVDAAHIWEDMASRNGSLISPAMFRKFMLPCYRKITRYVKRRGVRIVTVDSDGDCRELAPLFMEGGVTGVWPFEVQAGNDVREYRQRHPRLAMLGGLDKRAMAAGKAAIDQELAKVPDMLKHGGYVPAPDHLIPHDVSWDNYSYFNFRLKELIGKK